MFTAARGAKTRKARTVAPVQASTKMLISSTNENTIDALRLQRLRLIGIIGARAEILAQLVWGEAA